VDIGALLKECETVTRESERSKRIVLMLTPWVHHHAECARNEAESCDCGLQETLLELKRWQQTLMFPRTLTLAESDALRAEWERRYMGA
jgi:hypothetical protein